MTDWPRTSGARSHPSRQTWAKLPSVDVPPAGHIAIVGEIVGKSTGVERSSGTFPYYALVYLHEGGGSVRVNSELYTAAAGDLIVLFPGVAHAYEPIPGTSWDESYAVFSGTLFDALAESRVLDPERPLVRGLDPLEWGNRINATLRAVAGVPPTPDAVALGLLVSLLCDVSAHAHSPRLDASDSEWLARVYAVFEEDGAMAVPLTVVARRMGTSYDAFLKRFTRLSGTSPGRARTRVVMERACRLLRTSRRPVSEISDQLGFSDPSHFSNRFLSRVGRRPLDFRRDHGV